MGLSGEETPVEEKQPLSKIPITAYPGNNFLNAVTKFLPMIWRIPLILARQLRLPESRSPAEQGEERKTPRPSKKGPWSRDFLYNACRGEMAEELSHAVSKM